MVQVLHIIVAGLLLPTEFRPARPDPARPGSLHGEWQLVSTRDEKHTEAGCKQSRMLVMSDGTVIFRVADRVMNQAAVRLGKLGSLDLTLADGKMLRALYEQKGDELTICFAEAGQDRPAGISPKGLQWAETWKRVKR